MLIGARTAAWSGKKLPYDKRVNYLVCTGEQYINLGIPLSNTDVIKAKFTLNSGTGGVVGTGLFGARNNSASSLNISGLYTVSYSVLDFNNSNYSTYRLVGNFPSAFPFSVEMESSSTKRSISYNGGTPIVNQNVCVDVFTTNTAYLFNVNATGFSKLNGYGHSFEIVGKLKLIPVLATFDGVQEACMFNELYDGTQAHGQQFYRNAGTGAFGWGELSSAARGGGIS